MVVPRVRPVVLTVWQFPNRTLAILSKTLKKQQLKTLDEAKTCRYTSDFPQLIATRQADMFS